MKIKRFKHINEDITSVEKLYSVTIDIPNQIIQSIR